jgi:hypothetical protein
MYYAQQDSEHSDGTVKLHQGQAAPKLWRLVLLLAAVERSASVSSGKDSCSSLLRFACSRFKHHAAVRYAAALFWRRTWQPPAFPPGEHAALWQRGAHNSRPARGRRSVNCALLKNRTDGPR